eukprot:scaffold36613_cov66-Skeletonema_marinoi.AAC.1
MITIRVHWQLIYQKKIRLKMNGYLWLCNCYQLRCDDDYDKRGGKIHGPYVPDATTPESLAGDFLIFCVLAKQTVQRIPYAFDKTDAVSWKRWGSEDWCEADEIMG